MCRAKLQPKSPEPEAKAAKSNDRLGRISVAIDPESRIVGIWDAEYGVDIRMTAEIDKLVEGVASMIPTFKCRLKEQVPATALPRQAGFHSVGASRDA